MAKIFDIIRYKENRKIKEDYLNKISSKSDEEKYLEAVRRQEKRERAAWARSEAMDFTIFDEDN